MKLKNFFSFFFVAIFFASQLSAQDITTDTTLANEYFQKASEYYNNKIYDTAATFYAKASTLYEKHNLWRKYLQSQIKNADCYSKQWQFDSVIYILKPAIEKSLQHINENDTIVADAYYILGDAHKIKSEYDEALKYYFKSLEIRKELLGEKSVDVADLYLSIGNVYYEETLNDKAFEYYSKSLKIYKKSLGKKSLQAAIVYDNIGNIYKNKSQYDKALEYFFRSLKIKKELIGEVSVGVADSYINIGNVYYDKSIYKIALNYYLKSLEIYKKLVGEKSLAVADVYNNIGNIYSDKSQYDKALEYLLKSLGIYKELLGEKSFQVAKSYNNIGNVYSAKNQYDTALEYLLKSLEIRKKLHSEETVNVANLYNNIANVYYHKYQYDEALSYYFKSLEIYKELLGEKSVQMSTVYNNIGNIYSAKSQYDTALEYYFKSLEIRKKLLGEKSIEVANSYSNIGDVYYDKLLYDKALDYYLKGLEIRKEFLGENSFEVSNSYSRIAFVYIAKFQYDIALEYFLKSLEINKKLFGENSINVAYSYDDIGTVYFYKSQYDKALEYLFKSLEIRKKLSENSIDLTFTYDIIGIIYSYKSQYDKAFEYLFKSLEIRKKLLGENSIDVANSYSSIGYVYIDKSQYNKALEYSLKSLQIALKLFDEISVNVAMLYNNVGFIYEKKSEYDKAFEYYSKILKISKKLHDEKSLYIGNTYNNIGNIYAAKSQYDKALKYLFKSLKIKQEVTGEKSIDIAYCYNSIGKVYAAKYQYDTAFVYLFKSLEMYKELLGDKNFFVAHSYNTIGNVYTDKAEYKTALKYYHLAMYSDLWNFSDTTDITQLPVIKDNIEYDQLLQSLQAKARIFAYHSDSLDLGLSKTEYLQLALKHLQAADTLIKKTYHEISNEADKCDFEKTTDSIYNDAINVCLLLYDQTNDDKYLQQAFYFSERNKSYVLLENLAATKALKSAGIPDSLVNLEHELNMKIINYTILRNKADNDSIRNLWYDRLFNAQQSHDSLITVLETQYPDYYNHKYNTKPTSIEQLQKLLPDTSILISYSIADSTMTIFAISKKDFKVVQVPLLDSLSDKISLYLNSIRNKKEIHEKSHKSIDQYQTLAYEFYNFLFPAEIQDFLNRKIKNLIIIPDGELAKLPFETFHTSKYTAQWTNWLSKTYFADMPYLIKKYNISYNYSATLFYQTLTKTHQSAKYDWVGIAPVFDDGNINGLYIPPLPGTEVEVDSIYNLFITKNKKALVKKHKQANESFVKSSEIGNYKIVHLATYGLINIVNPKFSYILLAYDSTAIDTTSIDAKIGLITSQNEGILYQAEIYNLNLNADLVVLSACQTGLGKVKRGEGLIGFSRAFMYAGARNLIVSLWSVDDKSTSMLMINFYKNLLNSKKQDKFSKSLSEAKRQIIKDGKYAHPYFWSPFILIGE